MRAKTVDNAALAEVYITAFKSLPPEVQREIWNQLRRDLALHVAPGEPDAGMMWSGQPR